MGILETIFTLIFLVVAVFVGLIPFEIIAKFSEMRDRAKTKTPTK